MILDAVHQHLLLTAVDDLTGKFDELLWITLEAVKAPTRTQNGLDATPHELRSILCLAAYTLAQTKVNIDNIGIPKPTPSIPTSS